MNQNNLSIKEEHINETQNMIQTGKKPETKLETKSEIETEIRTKEVRITKAELKKLVIATAIHFYEKGVKSRDVVAICLENSLEYIITFLAVTYFGASKFTVILIVSQIARKLDSQILELPHEDTVYKISNFLHLFLFHFLLSFSLLFSHFLSSSLLFPLIS